MRQLTILLVITYVLCTLALRRRPQYALADRQNRWNPYLILLIVLLALPIGLRVDYNDTGAYVHSFLNAPTLSEFFSDAENLDFRKNPLFELYTVILRGWTDNYHIYFMLPALFITGATVSFLRKISDQDTFTLNVYTYFTLGTYLFALAAMKQTIAMAILLYAILALRDKKYVRFVLLTVIAGLFHTYAFLLLMLPALTIRPWTWLTYLIVAITVAVMLTFKSSISSLLQYADAIGKGASSEEVFSGAGMNTFRVAVYGVVPVVSLLYQRRLLPQMEKKHYLLLHMSIVSFMLMLLASIDGANMFGRMARYFEIGTVCMFPWIIRHLYAYKPQRVALFFYVIAFFAFFAYGYQDFSASYHGITLWQFLRGVH